MVQEKQGSGFLTGSLFFLLSVLSVASAAAVTAAAALAAFLVAAGAAAAAAASAAPAAAFVTHDGQLPGDQQVRRSVGVTAVPGDGDDAPAQEFGFRLTAHGPSHDCHHAQLLHLFRHGKMP